ncbi:hypothetical protein [Arthrobacter pigmenti]
MTQRTAQLLEADWEGLALDLLGEPLGWEPKQGEGITPAGERQLGRFARSTAISRGAPPPQPGCSAEYLQQALAEITSRSRTMP